MNDPQPSRLVRFWRTFGRPTVCYLAAALAAALIGAGLFALIAVAGSPSLETFLRAGAAAMMIASVFAAAVAIIAVGVTWTAHTLEPPRPLADLVFGAAIGPALYALFLTVGTYDLPLFVDNLREVALLAIAGFAGGAVYWRLSQTRAQRHRA